MVQSIDKALKATAIIPAYKESRFIGDVVRRTLAQPCVDEVIVIDDGSNDSTAESSISAGAHVIIHEKNLGKGAAIQTGLKFFFENRNGSFVVVLDGDGQHRPEEIPEFIEGLKNNSGTDLFVGNRMSNPNEMPLVRRYTNYIMSKLISMLCHQQIQDSQCGFRLFKRELIPDLLNRAAGYDYETEVLLLTSSLGKHIGAIPVSTIYRDETSHIRPARDTLRFLKLIFRYMFRKNHRNQLRNM